MTPACFATCLKSAPHTCPEISQNKQPQ
uniref:Uncharacterized protein n=1 Tax=Anguilla anguilla TaxID=7936 RepID=A0A0E9SQY6_ANGAN